MLVLIGRYSDLRIKSSYENSFCDFPLCSLYRRLRPPPYVGGSPRQKNVPSALLLRQGAVANLYVSLNFAMLTYLD